jgi:hypothetical protein
VGRRRGREIRRRTRVCTRRSTASVEGAELTGRVHGAERGERGVRGNGSRLAARACETERKRERVGKKTGADRLAPLGSERGRAGARVGDLLLTGGVRLSDGTGARPGWANWAGLGCFQLFFFSEFSNSFSISFSIGFLNPNSN